MSLPPSKLENFKTSISTIKDEIDAKEILKQNLQALIQLEKEQQEKLKKENENLLDYSKEMIHDVIENK
ncbi:hypothetical protein HANVADRAFT_51421 [Hanseniaspora valbyensis NRRL Y-1626]|uniref:Uncharacterized protein n=1 Tax=Hanseniaspora valbyensis NRRL Y-1626 TaxID=766949 RepID=A0A1B7TIF7_9ASCO|nr:hypothetical protein HANVADRAFT_51421 [Hanseniaspora valbyensis NRRL Y-1626]